MDKIVNYLKQADIFYQLTKTQLEMIANICKEEKYSLNAVIVEEGSTSKDLYIITNGEVDVLINPELISGSGTPKKEMVIAKLKRGQSFGEIALVDEGLRTATVRATIEDTRVLVISQKKLLVLCEAYPPLGYRLMYNLSADLAMKMRSTDLRIREQMLYEKQ